MKLLNAVAIRIQKLIDERKDMTIYKVAKNSGMSCATVWKVIHHDPNLVKTVKLDTIYQIAASLDMSLKDFFDDPIFAEVDD